jgi:UDP-N-acetylmuramoyl-L-alanyl-D-glutamate--2,6-diaminopimelate ligase
MGKAVLNGSDIVIFTMDDPRYEDPQEIIKEMIGKSKKQNYEVVTNRKEAIYRGLSLAKADDIIFIAGKGRDNYMAIEDQFIPYCDYDVIEDYFKEKK